MMLFAKAGSRKERKENERIDSLRVERGKSRDRLSLLNMKIRQLVEKSMTADPLDEKVNSYEYRILKDELASEKAHFEDLSHAIERLETARRTRERHETLRQIAEINDTVDVDKMMEQEDYIAACREFTREEDRAYQEVVRSVDAPKVETLEDEEFHRMVERARLEKTMGSGTAAEHTEKAADSQAAESAAS